MPRRLPLQLVLRSPPSSYRWQLLFQSGLWSIKCGNRCVHNCSSLMHTPNPNQKPNGWIQDSSPAAAYKVDTTWAFSLVPPTSPPQLAMKVSANGPQKLGAAMSPTPNNLGFANKNTTGCVTLWHCHLHLKRIVRQKKNYGNSNMQKSDLQKTSSKRNPKSFKIL